MITKIKMGFSNAQSQDALDVISPANCQDASVGAALNMTGCNCIKSSSTTSSLSTNNSEQSKTNQRIVRSRKIPARIEQWFTVNSINFIILLVLGKSILHYR